MKKSERKRASKSSQHLLKKLIQVKNFGDRGRESKKFETHNKRKHHTVLESNGSGQN